MARQRHKDHLDEYLKKHKERVVNVPNDRNARFL